MKSIAKRLRGEIFKFYKENNLSLNSPQLVALSGGSDSVALTALLRPICPLLQGAYFNHGLRKEVELKEEISFLRNFSATLNLPLHIGESPRGKLKKEAQNSKSSLEDIARIARYEFLDSVMENQKLSYLVLAHHGDDQAETLVSRFFQGSGPAGLSGIKAVNGSRIRPLLNFSKQDILSFLKEEELTWSEDKTNREDIFQRNRIRLNLIPQLKEVFPGINRSLPYLAEKMTRIDNYLKENAKDIRWINNSEGLSMDLFQFNSLHPALREYIILQALDKLLKGTLLPQGKGRRVPYRFIRPLLSGNIVRSFHLSGHGLIICVKEENLYISHDKKQI